MKTCKNIVITILLLTSKIFAQTISNDDFTSGSNNWDICGNSTEILNTSQFHGGNVPYTPENFAEIDAGADNLVGTSDDNLICQSISGFIIGNCYEICLDVMRRPGPSDCVNIFGQPGTTTSVLKVDNGALNTLFSESGTTWAWNTICYTFTATSTTHQLTISPANGSSCGNLIDVITISSNSPSVNDLPDTSLCSSYTLPGITGTNLSGNQAYYTAPNGGGTQYLPGDIINTSTTLHISDGSCSNEESFTITIGGVINGTDTHTTCGSFTWIDGNTYTTNNNTATHTIVGGSTNGCDSIVTLNLTIENAVTSIDNHTTCGSLTWIDGNTYTTNNNTATHTIVGGAANGCDSIITLNLTISNAIISIDSQTACSSFTWIDGNTYTTNNNTATYTIIGGSTNGCDSTITLNLTILQPATGIDTKTSCESIIWIDGNTYTTNNNTATYTIIGGSTNGCDSIVTLNLTIHPPLSFNISNDTGVCNNSVTLEASSGFNSYLWNTGETSNSINTSTPDIYNVTVTDINGCEANASVEVYKDCPFTLWIPNVFTPNGDSYNNVFKIKGENLESLDVSIFNRWGQKLHSWNGLNGFWDGKTNSGSNAPDGVYMYVLNYSYYNKTALIREKKIGHISLLR